MLRGAQINTAREAEKAGLVARAGLFNSTATNRPGTSALVAALSNHHGPHGAPPASFAPHGPFTSTMNQWSLL